MRKRDLIERLASMLADEIHTLPPEDWRRPINSFVLERIVPPLNRPIPVGASD
jgi:hypothetical protein